MKIVSITGKANSGKNTVGKLIRKSFYYARGGGVKFFAFADPIKEMIRIMFPQANRKCLYGPSSLRSEIIPGAFKNGLPLTYRQLLIDLGKQGRDYNPSIWIDVIIDRMTKAKNRGCQLAIVTDVRFRNEFDALTNMGAYKIRVERLSCARIDDVSETNQDLIKNSEMNSIIDNNGSLKDLRRKIDDLMNYL